MAASDEVTSVNSVELKLSADDPLLPLRPELSEDSEIRQLFKQFLVSLVDQTGNLFTRIVYRVLLCRTGSIDVRFEYCSRLSQY